MPSEIPQLLEDLNSVTAIPIIPFKNGKIDYTGHAKNVDYLMRNNYLDQGRKRVIAIAGTSLIHHISETEQLRLIDKTGQQIGDDGILMSGIVPNPIRQAGQLIEAQSELQRPPDVYLLMPLTGVSNPEGIYEEYMNSVRRMALLVVRVFSIISVRNAISPPLSAYSTILRTSSV